MLRGQLRGLNPAVASEAPLTPRRAAGFISLLNDGARALTLPLQVSMTPTKHSWPLATLALTVVCLWPDATASQQSLGSDRISRDMPAELQQAVENHVLRHIAESGTARNR